MKNIISCVVYVCMIIHILPAQSGWTQAQGSGYFKLNQSAIRAGQFFNPEGETIDITTTSVYSTVFYGEYGLTNRFTALVNAQLFIRSTINDLESRADGFIIPGDELNSIGEIQLGLKYGILQKGPVILAASGLIKLPSGESVGGATELLQTGDGAWGALGMLHASHSFYPQPFYTNLSIGYQWRGTADLDYSTGTQTVDYDDAFVWGGEIGWTPNTSWAIALKWTQVQPPENESAEGLTGNSSIFGNRLTYFSVIPEVNYILPSKWGISASVGGVLFAKNILAAPSYNLGIFYLLNQQ